MQQGKRFSTDLLERLVYQVDMLKRGVEDVAADNFESEGVIHSARSRLRVSGRVNYYARAHSGM